MIEGDVRVLHHPQRDLALDLGCGVAGVVLLHDERLDLPVVRVSGEDHDHVAPHGVAGPALTAVDHPLAAVAPGRGLQDDRVGPVIGLGERERPDLVQPGHRRQPALPLLLRAEQVDRLHRQSDVHGEERRDAAVDTAELISQQARADGRHRRRAVARHGVADDVQRGELGHQLERELAPLPVRVDDRQYLGFGELPHPVEQPQLILGQLVFHQEVIGLTGEPDVLRQRGDCCRHGHALPFELLTAT